MAFNRNFFEILFGFSSFEILLMLLISVPIAFLLQLYRSRGLFFDLTVTYYLPPIHAGDIKIASQTATFRRTLRLPRGNITGSAARAAIEGALRELHISDEAELREHSGRIVARGSKHMAQTLERRSWIRRLTKKIRVEPQIVLRVDALPPVTGLDYIGEDDGVRILRASKEFARGLGKAREKRREAVACQVCFKEAPAGSEMTRLPCCLHHTDCILWSSAR